MIYTNFEQRSTEWFQMRTGCLTASRMHDALNKPKSVKAKEMGKELEARIKYKRELAIERLTGDAYDHYNSDFMNESASLEPLARTEYEFCTGNEVKMVGLAVHDRIKWFCASPDGLIGHEGLVEIKRLTPLNHFEIVETGKIPEEYEFQMDGQLMCTGRKWCDFVSYCPLANLPEHLRLHIIQYRPQEAILRGRELEVEQFLKEVAETVYMYARRKGAALQESVR